MKYMINFINKKRKIRNKYTSKEIVTSLIVISVLLYIEKINIVYCGTISTETAVTQLQDLTRTFTDEEADEFARQLQFQPNQGWHDQYNVDQVKRNSIQWESVVIFVVATTILYIFARHGDVIRDTLFNIPNQVSNISLPSTQDIYAGMARIMHNLGRGSIFRQELAMQAAHLLNDPETAGRVEAAMQAVRAMRDISQ